MRIVVLGAPGAGKGTQCQYISDTFGFVHLSSGDILRSEIASGTTLGLRAKSLIDEGKFVPDEVVIDVMLVAIKKVDSCVLDGFPRTVVQAKELDLALSKMYSKIDIVINLIVDEHEIVARLEKRRSCPKCGRVYHLDYSKPEVEGVCDFDGCVLYHRDDDKRDVILNRLKTYHQLTEPLVDYYNESQSSEVFNIVADGKIEVIRADIIEKIHSILNG